MFTAKEIAEIEKLYREKEEELKKLLLAWISEEQEEEKNIQFSGNNVASVAAQPNGETKNDGLKGAFSSEKERKQTPRDLVTIAKKVGDGYEILTVNKKELLDLEYDYAQLVDWAKAIPKRPKQEDINSILSSAREQVAESLKKLAENNLEISKDDSAPALIMDEDAEQIEAETNEEPKERKNNSIDSLLEGETSQELLMPDVAHDESEDLFSLLNVGKNKEGAEIAEPAEETKNIDDLLSMVDAEDEEMEQVVDSIDGVASESDIVNIPIDVPPRLQITIPQSMITENNAETVDFVTMSATQSMINAVLQRNLGTGIQQFVAPIQEITQDAEEKIQEEVQEENAPSLKL